MVKELDPLTDPRWDAYVRAHPSATIYQLGAWAAILGRAYGFRPHYLALENDGRLAGVLPLLRKKGFISDDRIRSVPVFGYGGPLGDSRGEEIALLDAARALADREGIRGLSVNTGVRPIDGDGFERSELHSSWIIELPDDLDALRAGWRKTSNNLYRSLRKADRSELRFREARSNRDVRSIHRLYMEAMRRHRSLPRTARQLRLARDLLGPEMRMFIVSHGGRDVAASVYHVFGDTVELVYNGSDEDALALRPNHLLYWEVMRWAAERGLRHIDLGGAYEGTPLARFKQQWGATPHPRYKLDHRAGGETTRAESIAAIGYGAEGSESRIVDFGWRHIPLPVLHAGAHLAYRYV
jgi:CelD/BcsL family acetyltransferase involved in cellulose biosynthesis